MQRSGNAQAAYDQIRQAIVEGRYPPGQRLVEQRIAEEFDLSRTPIREALRRLDAEGLVDSRPNRGAIVRELSLDDVSDLYGLRARLESYAAERAAERITEAQVADLNEGILAFAAAMDAPDVDDLARTRAIHRANQQIHGVIVHAAGHERLLRMLEGTVDVPLVFQAFVAFDREQTERSHLFHCLIRDALIAGDGRRAGALMYEHVLQGGDVIIERLRSAQSASGADRGEKVPKTPRSAPLAGQ